MKQSSEDKKGFNALCAVLGTPGHDVLRAVVLTKNVGGYSVECDGWQDGRAHGVITVTLEDPADRTKPFVESVAFSLCVSDDPRSFSVDDRKRAIWLVEEAGARSVVSGLRPGDGGIWILPHRREVSLEMYAAYAKQALFALFVNPARKRLSKLVPPDRRASERHRVHPPSGCGQFEDVYAGLFDISTGFGRKKGGGMEMIDIFVRESPLTIAFVESLVESPNWGGHTDGSGDKMVCTLPVPFTVGHRRITLKIHLGEYPELPPEVAYLEEQGADSCVLVNVGAKPMTFRHSKDDSANEFTREKIHRALERVFVHKEQARFIDEFSTGADPLGAAVQGGPILLG